jgi:hypothetical protein
MLSTFSQRVIGVAATLAAATGALALAAPAASAAPSAGACHTQLATAGIRVSQSAYAAEFGVEQGPFEHHDFVYTDLASARTTLNGPACSGIAVVQAEVALALVKIDEGEAALRADDWAGSAEALGVADDALQSAAHKAWRLAHPN